MRILSLAASLAQSLLFLSYRRASPPLVAVYEDLRQRVSQVCRAAKSLSSCLQFVVRLLLITTFLDDSYRAATQFSEHIKQVVGEVARCALVQSFLCALRVTGCGIADRLAHILFSSQAGGIVDVGALHVAADGPSAAGDRIGFSVAGVGGWIRGSNAGPICKHSGAVLAPAHCSAGSSAHLRALRAASQSDICLPAAARHGSQTHCSCGSQGSVSCPCSRLCL